MGTPLETDYLVIGTGASAMAFTDALLSFSDATVTLVDKRHAPGGHWIDAYPFVRLHQPSAFYGVSSVPLGNGTVDRAGINAGFHELASADELCAYYAHVMDQHFLPTRRVRHLPCHKYSLGPSGGHCITSLLTGEMREVRVRRKVVDTSYLEGKIPATSPPPFEVAEGVHCISAGDVTRLAEPPSKYVVIGSGKTALDTCVWLLTQGVPAHHVQWVRPREGWWLNRRFLQPEQGLPDFLTGVGLQVKAMAEGTSVDDVFMRLEAEEFVFRVDRSIVPTMSRGAIMSEVELALLRQIEDVVRRGHVRRIERDRIVFDDGSIPTDPSAVHIHCAASALARVPLRPVFEGDRITLQALFWSFACFPTALLGVAEATIPDTAEKNRLFPPIHYWEVPRDYLIAHLALMAHERARKAYPSLTAWVRSTRLNPFAGLKDFQEDHRVLRAGETIKHYGPVAATNLARLIQSA